MFSDTPPVHCGTVHGKVQRPLLTAALQDRLAAGLYHCNHSCEDLLLTQVCSDSTAVHFDTVQGKMQCPLLGAALQDKLAAGMYHCNHSYEDLLFIQMCGDPTPVHCNTAQAKNSAHCSVLLCKTGLQQAITPIKICCSYRCALTTAAVHWCCITVQL